jgi:hypothetical protein
VLLVLCRFDGIALLFLHLCPPFEYCSIFTSLATCSFLNSPINFRWMDVLCRLSFSVCCSSLQNGYWFLVLQFGSSSRLVEKNVLLSRSQLHNQLVWCSHLLVLLFQCDNQKSSTLCRGRSGRQAARRTSLVTSGTSL